MTGPDPEPGQLCNIHGAKKNQNRHPPCIFTLPGTHGWMDLRAVGAQLHTGQGRMVGFNPHLGKICSSSQTSSCWGEPQPSLAESRSFGILAVPSGGLEGVDEAGRGAQSAGRVPVRSRDGDKPQSAPSPGWDHPLPPGVSPRRLIPAAHGERRDAARHGRSSRAGTSEDSDIGKAAGGKAQALELRLFLSNPRRASPHLQPRLFLTQNEPGAEARPAHRAAPQEGLSYICPAF